MVEEAGIYEEEFGMYIIQAIKLIKHLHNKKRLPDINLYLVHVKQALFCVG